MPLPNLDGQKITPGESYSPNAAALQQMGTNVNQVRKLQDQNQAIAKVLDNISARLGNITNIRTNVQSASFDAFGNNFLTRGMNQIASSITDSIESLFSSEEEQQEDPTIKAIKEQTKISTEILEQTKTHIGLSKNIASLITDQNKTSHLLLEFAKHPRANEQMAKEGEKQRNVLYKQENTLKDILKALVDREIMTPKDMGIRGNPKAEDITIEAETGEVQTPEQAEAAKSKKRKYRTKKVLGESEQTPTKYTAGNSTYAVFGSMGKDIRSSKEILSQILDAQKKTSDSIEKLVAGDIKPTKTPEAIALETPEAEIATPEVRTGFWKGARESLFGRPKTDQKSMFANLFNRDAFGKTASKLEEKAAATMDEAPAAQAGSNVDISVDLPDRAKTVGKSGAATKAGKMLKFAKGAAITAAAMGAMGYAADATMGAFGVGKDAEGKDLQVDTAQDDANWNKMKWYEKLQSGAARGVEKVGSFMFLDNISREAQATRIKNETAYLQGRDANASISEIEKSQKAIENTKKVAQESPATSVNQTTMVNNQTIMPNRAVVKNTDDSYNRYLNSIL